MNTEITETIRGYVFYDAHCPICRRWVGRIHLLLVRRGLHPVPLQAPWAKCRLGLADSEPLVEMKFLDSKGAIYGGADALAQIARAIWWAWPQFVLAQLPGIKALLRKTYLRMAANRPCDDRSCAIIEHKTHKPHRHGAFYELP